MHTETTQYGYIAKGGVRIPGKRGHSNDALKACIRKWSLLVMQANAAKRHCMCVQVFFYVPEGAESKAVYLQGS